MLSADQGQGQEKRSCACFYPLYLLLFVGRPTTPAAIGSMRFSARSRRPGRGRCEASDTARRNISIRSRDGSPIHPSARSRNPPVRLQPEPGASSARRLLGCAALGSQAGFRPPAPECPAQSNVEDRCQEEAEQRHAQHAGEHGRSERLAHFRARPAGDH